MCIRLYYWANEWWCWDLGQARERRGANILDSRVWSSVGTGGRRGGTRYRRVVGGVRAVAAAADALAARVHRECFTSSYVIASGRR